MPYFFELLTDISKKRFTRIALQIRGPDWKPIVSRKDVDTTDAERIMKMTPEEFKQKEM